LSFVVRIIWTGWSIFV